MIASKLDAIRKFDTSSILSSLAPGTAGALRVKRDGTVLNGNHRVAVLRERGIAADALPREVYEAVGIG
jgi:hypothetical protein